MEERKLIQLARDGNAEAFCQLYDSYKDRLYRYAFYRLRSRQDAEDAVSECLLSAWQQVRMLRSPEAFPAWIFRILSGSCNRLIRCQINARRLQAAESAADTTAPDSQELSDTRMMLQKALSQLTEQEQEIVLLSVVGGLSSQEIAGMTGLRPGSVRSKLSRSLKKLRNLMG